MNHYRRYALYYSPPAGDFADFGAQWLGWDLRQGREVAQPALPGMDVAAVTAAPRKYGFHATLKAPFRLREDARAEALGAAVEKLAAGCQAVTLAGLTLTPVGRFLALTPEGDTAALNALAARLGEGLEPFRAPLTEAERARRNPDRLTEYQRDLLDNWGYPYVFDEFRFHMTLTGGLDGKDQGRVTAFLKPRLAVLPRPFRLDAISLVGEAEDGRFRLIRRFPL